MHYIFFALVIAITACTSPGRLRHLTKHGVVQGKERSIITVTEKERSSQLVVQYTGCGGLYLAGGTGIWIDPFFSHQKVMRIGASVFGGGSKGKRKFKSDPKMIDVGMKHLQQISGSMPPVDVILSAHSHYDHLMDVPIIYQKLSKRPLVYLNQSGFNTCYNVLDTSDMVVLEQHMTTQEVTRPPIIVNGENGQVHIYPILSEHNPHFKNIKFFSGRQTEPVKDFTDAYGKTRGNDWLEGNTFSFLIDYLNEAGAIDFRIFIQSSSCSAPAGVPPATLIKDRTVDVAFLGVVSYHFSPNYPCTLLETIRPKEIVWMHWEDFFRKYTKDPKTVRGTDIPAFFDLPCVGPYKSKSIMPWPGVTMDIK